MSDQLSAAGGSNNPQSSPDGRYVKCAELLGKGAYKVVHKAIDREEGYEVAWNTCQMTTSAINSGKADLMAITEEIEILKRVRHNNIIQFYDYWFSNSEFIFITELMTSGTIREYMKKLTVLNEKIIKRWGRQIIKGIYFLHSHNPPIIHRDIKCDNIFVNGCYGEVKIGDMGTSKMKIGKKYTVIGTPEFMAPEMYEEKGYNENVDIYAFGMTLLEMVTNEYPYGECKNAAQVYKKVSQGIRPDCLKKITNPDILDLIIRCTDVDSKRISAAEVLEHKFLACDPEVLFCSMESNNHLGMRVVFGGAEKLSVNFQFDPETDTSEQVVNEMIHEKVLPAEYRDLITGEINKILRNIFREKSLNYYPVNTSNIQSININSMRNGVDVNDNDSSLREISTSDKVYRQESFHNDFRKPPDTNTLEITTEQPKLKYEADIFQDSKSPVYFKNDVPVEVLVRWAAKLFNREQKIDEWLTALYSQDIATVGDLRQLHDEDWSSLSLTVFARRSIKNVLTCKNLPSISPQTTHKD